MSQTAIADLSPLAGLALQSLSLADTPVAHLAPLAPLASVETLYHVDVSRTRVTSLAALARGNIGFVAATGSLLSTLDGVADMPHLRRLIASGNAISDISSLTKGRPVWIDLTGNTLDAAAPTIIKNLCAAGWAFDWDGGSCGNTCSFESCTN